eukprot:GFKZ01008992.1.p2 GENE.GFKZ01008992.1~~GFKZ01008992.1.p2  ORF type:complete len:164 (+),score=30.75 GFKZ01008992.1:80-571(+)
MRVANIVRRASHSVTESDTARLVNEAARRATDSDRARGRPRRLRGYLDLIAIGVGSLAAATALKRRREYEERVSLLEAKLTRAQADRDKAMQLVQEVKNGVVERVPQAVRKVDALGYRIGKTGVLERVQALQVWVEESFQSSLSEIELRDETSKAPREKPKVI